MGCGRPTTRAGSRETYERTSDFKIGQKFFLFRCPREPLCPRALLHIPLLSPLLLASHKGEVPSDSEAEGSSKENVRRFRFCTKIALKRHFFALYVDLFADLC